jgi:hypothetical protein
MFTAPVSFPSPPTHVQSFCSTPPAGLVTIRGGFGTGLGGFDTGFDSGAGFGGADADAGLAEH